LNFLKHISRTGHLLFLLDPQNIEKSIDDQLAILLNELKTYDPTLLDKSIWIAINKKDTLDDQMQMSNINLVRKKMLSLKKKYKCIENISGFTGDNTSNLLGMIARDLYKTSD